MSYPEPYGMECHEGWNLIIEDTHNKLSYIDPNYTILQIKEKFGGLRYYFSTLFDYESLEKKIMDDIVSCAETQASYTCELCGANGWGTNVQIRVHKYWYFSYCHRASIEYGSCSRSNCGYGFWTSGGHWNAH
jgi:hypothetical protein